jgi:hypothetical protein
MRKAPTGMDNSTGVNTTMPGRPYFFFIITSRLLRLLKIFFDFGETFHFTGQNLFFILISKSEKLANTTTPRMPPIFEYTIVSTKDNRIANTAIGKVAANFQLQKKIIVISFINTELVPG